MRWLALVVLIGVGPLSASSSLNVRVTDVGKHPVSGIRIGVSNGFVSVTDLDGHVRLSLPRETKTGDSITIVLGSESTESNYLLISPWDGRVIVPASTDNIVEIVVALRKDASVLVSDEAITAATSRIVQQFTPQSLSEPQPADVRIKALTQVANLYGVSPSELDKSIREWGQTVTDPYKKGLVALYEEGPSPQAGAQLEVSIKQQREELKKEEQTVYESYLSVGKALYAEGRYEDASGAFLKAARILPDQPALLESWGLDLIALGRYGEAEALLQRAKDLLKESGNDRQLFASVLADLGEIARRKGSYGSAEALLRESLAIQEETLGSNHPEFANTLCNLGDVLLETGKFEEAKSTLRRALTIREKVLGENRPEVASSLSNLALVYVAEGQPAAAEPLLLRAIAIQEEALGPDHPDLAKTLSILARVLLKIGKPAEAEPLFGRALFIREKALGLEHPDTADSLDDLASVSQAKGDNERAELLLRRALGIQRKTLGLEHPSTANSLVMLGKLLCATRRCDEGSRFYSEALKIYLQVLGPEAQRTKDVQALVNSPKG